VADGAAIEQDLVLLARGLVMRSPEVTAMWGRGRALPPAISPACARLVGDALAQLWPALWRRGGTQPAASILSGGVRRGRIWERHAPVGLTFSVATLHVLRWLLGTALAAPITTIEPLPEAPLTIGDQVIIYLALDAATDPAQAAIAAQPLVRAAPLAWLGFADKLAGAPPGFAALCGGAGAIVVEALTGELAGRWRAVELRKRAMTDPRAVIALGAAQDAALAGWLAACDAHGRRDLASFVIDAAAPLIAAQIVPAPTVLDPTATLAQRAEARVAAGALLRGVLAWSAWDQAHRGVRFIDDDYAAAQVLLARFEPIQAAGAARAAAWLADLASLAPTTLPPSAATVDAP
jgi:FtsH ternary system domain X6